jgi:suppressor for copper-sensitivity B
MDRPLCVAILVIVLVGLLTLLPAGFAQQSNPPGEGQFGGFYAAAGAEGEPVTVTAEFTAPAEGQPAGLFITANIKPGWHIYSITQPPGGPIRTQITLEPSDAFRPPTAYQVSPPPTKHVEEAFGGLTVESHEGIVTWYAPLELRGGVDPAKVRIAGRLTVQACDANACLPPQDYPFTAVLGRGREMPAGPSAQPPVEAAGALDPDKLEVTSVAATSLLKAILLGFVGGVILNLMPCVLPVIGLKLLSFVEQAGHSRRQALVLNIWYSLGLMSVFLLLAALAAGPREIGWGELFSYNEFDIALAAVVFVMGLSFLGVWEIPIPGFAGRGKASELAQREGAAGAFSKGVLTTVLATPCTGPFMASALVWAAAQPPPNTYAVFTSIGLGMASPYLLIGAFPNLIKSLPKPGAWMDTFKQVMGFVLMGTVVYILTFVHWPYVVPTIGLLFALWGACWWVNRTPPTADLGAKLRAWLEAITFSGVLWVLLFPGIDEIFPGKYSFGGLYDVMVDRYEKSFGENELPWEPFTRPKFDQLTAQQKTVLVDFTADWCMTCKTLEKYILNTEAVRNLVNRNAIVTLKGDWTHRDPEVTEMLVLLGGKQVPTLAIFPAGDPNHPVVFRGGYTQQMLLDALEKAGPSKRS